MTNYAKKYKTKSLDAIAYIKKLEKENTALAAKLQIQEEMQLRIDALDWSCKELAQQLKDARRANAVKMRLGEYTLLFDGCEIVKS